MPKIVVTEEFQRKYLKLIKNNNLLREKYKKAIQLLSTNPHPNSLKSHKVVLRSIGEAFSSRISGDLRIIWIWGKDNTIYLLDTGGHSGKNKVY